jgi:hypothetical protein
MIYNSCDMCIQLDYNISIQQHNMFAIYYMINNNNNMILAAVG